MTQHSSNTESRRTFRLCRACLGIASLVLCWPVVTAAATIESWQFNDAAGVSLSDLANSAGTAVWNSNAANAVADGAGALVYSAGADASDNIFRTAPLTTPNLDSGIVELALLVRDAALAGGDASGANVGFGLREDGSNDDLFVVRLHRQNGALRLQTRITDESNATSNTTLTNFGTDSISDLLIRAVVDLDADMLDVHWKLGAGAEQSSTGIALRDREVDIVRMIANTNSTDWGADDTVALDFLTVAAIPEPATLPLLLAVGLLLTGRRSIIDWSPISPDQS